MPETTRSGTAEDGASEQEKAVIRAAIDEVDRELSHLSHFNHSSTNMDIVSFVGFVTLDKELKKQLAPFPVEHLPEEIKPYIEAAAESLQVPVDMIASFIITILSLCVQGKFWIKAKTDWEESLNLYIVVVGRPSERKSPALKETVRPLFKYMTEENEKRKPAISEYGLKKKILTGKLKHIQESLSKAGNKTKFTMQDAIDCQKELDELEDSKVNRLKLILDDVTPEALVKEMEANCERMGIISAEGGIFGMMAGRYNANTNIDIFLKGYSGEYYSSVRVGSGGATLEHPLLTIGLAVQPQVISDIMDDKNFRGRGLLARFMYSIPTTRVGKRVYRSKPISPVIRADYEKLVYDLLSIDDLGGFAERIIRLSPEADSISEEFNQWIEPRLTSEFEEIEDWAGKLHGNTMRIAGVLHVAKHKLNSVNVPLEADTMRSAIAIGKYYLEHSKAAFDIMGLSDPQDVQDAKYIISRLEQNDLNDFNDFILKRDAVRLCQRFKNAEEMEPGLNVLVEHGYIAIVKDKNGKRGRPSEKIYINPEYIRYKETRKAGITQGDNMPEEEEELVGDDCVFDYDFQDDIQIPF